MLWDVAVGVLVRFGSWREVSFIYPISSSPDSAFDSPHLDDAMSTHNVHIAGTMVDKLAPLALDGSPPAR